MPLVAAPEGARFTASAPLVSVRGLRLHRGRTEVLHDIDLDIEQGEFVAVVGTNGAGKTSLIQAIAGVVTPPRGTVHVDGLDVARTDARHTHGFSEALARIEAFSELGADVVFLEAPVDRDEMRTFCAATKTPALANMLEGGHTPLLPPGELEQLGYKVAAYPLTLLNAALVAMQRVLAEIQTGAPASGLMPFAELRKVVGFDAYDQEADRYRDG